MTRSRFAFYLGRIPILEVLAIMLGVAGMAGNFSVFGTEDQNWWNGMLIVCGALSACISLFADNFIPGHRKAVSAVFIVVGTSSLSSWSIVCTTDVSNGRTRRRGGQRVSVVLDRLSPSQIAQVVPPLCR